MAPIMLGKHRKAPAPPDSQQFADPIQQQTLQQQTASVQLDQQQETADPVQDTLQTRTQLTNGIPPAEEPVAPPEELTQAQKLELAQISNKKKREKRAGEMREENRQRILLRQQRIQERQQKDVPAETYQAERRNVIAGITDICKQIDQLDVEQDQKEEMIRNLQRSQTLLQNVTTYLTRTIPRDQASFETFLHMLYRCMGMINRSSNLTYNKLKELGSDKKDDKDEQKDQDKKKIPKETIAQLQNAMAGTAFIDNTLREHIQDVAWQAFYDGEHVTWGALFQRAMKEQVVDITGQKTGRMGQAMSSVTTIGTGEDTQFFKEDEHIQSEAEIIQDAQKEIKEGLATEEERQNVERFCHAEEGQLSPMNQVINLLDQKIDKTKTSLNNSDLLKLLKETGTLAAAGVTYLSNETAAKLIKEVLRRRMATSIGKKLGLEEGEGLSERNIATVRMASLLGMKEQVVHSQQIKLVQDGVTRSGFVMNKARGLDYTRLSKQAPPGHDEYTGEFQRQMMNLQLLDNICGQFDRHLNNVFFDYAKQGKQVQIRGITGIDNDMAFGTMYINSGAYLHMRSCMDENDNYIFPVVDRDFYEHLMAINADILFESLVMIHDNKYKDAVRARLDRIRTAITKALNEKPPTCRLVDKDGWGEDTLKELCKGETAEKNRSYLSRFVAFRRAQAGQKPL